MFNNFPEATRGGDIIHGASGFGLPPNETRYSDDRAAILHGKSATSIILSFSPGSTVRNVAVMVGTPPEYGRGKIGSENQEMILPPYTDFVERRTCSQLCLRVFTV
jgi:hypothetical protein